MGYLPRLLAGLILAGSLSLAGCADIMPSTTKTITTNMTGAQEVPANTTTGSGTATFTIDQSAKTITWVVTWQGLTGDAMAAHIHGPATPGVNAGVLINLAPNGMANPLKGTSALTDQQLAQIMSNQTYVNVHTPNNKGGEIRGQLTP